MNPIPTTLLSLVSQLRVYAQRNDQVEDEGLFETLRRFRILAAITLIFNLSYALIFWTDEAGRGTSALATWTNAIAWTHSIHGGINLVLGLALHRFIVQGKRSKPIARALMISGCITGLGAAIALSVIDQLVSPNTTNFAVIALVIGMTSLMRPLLSMAIFIPAYLIFYVAVAITQTDPTMLSIARSHSLIGILLSLTVSWLVWHQYAKSVLLRRELTDAYAKSVLLHGELADANATLEQRQKELTYLATRDSLTGLYVRREFARLTQMELARAVRQKTNTALVMVDLDHFKRINDQYGHPAGDEILQGVAKILTAALRTTDVIARMGGEEFVILLPDTSREGAKTIAEKLRLALRNEPLPAAGHLLPVTTSLGISVTESTHATSYEDLYAAADAALYAAKQGGRDRVEINDPAHQVGGPKEIPAETGRGDEMARTGYGIGIDTVR